MLTKVLLCDHMLVTYESYVYYSQFLCQINQNELKCRQNLKFEYRRFMLKIRTSVLISCLYITNYLQFYIGGVGN